MATEARRGFSAQRVPGSAETERVKDGLRDWFRLFVIQFLSTDSVWGGYHIGAYSYTALLYLHRTVQPTQRICANGKILHVVFVRQPQPLPLAAALAAVT